MTAMFFCFSAVSQNLHNFTTLLNTFHVLCAFDVLVAMLATDCVEQLMDKALYLLGIGKI